METPSQSIVAAGNKTATVTDAGGRVIVLKKLNALDRMRLSELVGGENVHNDVYFGYASLAYHVQSIDGEPVLKPSTKAQLEALVQLLDDAGLEAAGRGISDNFMPPAAGDVDPKDQVKN